MNPTTKSQIHHVTTLSMGCKLSTILTENIHTGVVFWTASLHIVFAGSCH